MNTLSIRRILRILPLAIAAFLAAATTGQTWASDPTDGGSGSAGEGAWSASGGGEDPSPWPWSDKQCRERFDSPLVEFHRLEGSDFRIVSAGAATGGEDALMSPELTIEIAGSPAAAWLYWIGETRAIGRLAGSADPSVTLEKLVDGKLSETRELFGEEIGRRQQLFTDEVAPGCAGNGGEVAMRAAVPLDLFSKGSNQFRLPAEDCLSCFNESAVLCEGRQVPIYRKAFGITLVVILEGAASLEPGEVISLGGADYITRGKTSRRPECDPAQTRSELTCFDFDPLAADSAATLAFGVAGLLPRMDEKQRLSTSEQTLFGSAAGLVSASALAPLETNQLSDETYFYLGRNISLYEGLVQLKQGDTQACFRLDLPSKKEHEKEEQSAVLVHASLVLARGDSPSSSGERCALDPGESAQCAVLQLDKKKLQVKGDAGGIVGDACVAPKGKFEISGEQFVDGRVRLGAGASYKRKDEAWVGSVSYDEDLSEEVHDAEALAEDAASERCTQSFGKVTKSLTIVGEPGLNVICIKELDLSKGEVLTLHGDRESTFVVNLRGKTFKLKDGARTALAGGVRADGVLWNLIGKGKDVELGGGQGGESCCETVVEGTLLAPARKIKLRPGLVRGALISAEDVVLERGAALRARPLRCLDH